MNDWHFLAAALIAAAAVQGCSDQETLDPLATTSTSSGTGGSSAASATSSSSSSSSSSSGAGGGDGGVTCLDPGAYADLFTIKAPGFCAVAVYTIDEQLGAAAPAWGMHGGPLTLRAGQAPGSIDLVRWNAPAGATGKLTSTVTTVDAMIPMGAFLSAQAIDLPFFGWTALSWSGAYPMTQGEVVLVAGSKVSARYPVNGAFGIEGVASDQDHGRLLSTGLSALNDAAANTNALYAADSCGTSAMPSLLPGMDPTCSPPLSISTWGDSSGPIATDSAGNVFAVMASFATGDQEARGFAASTIGRGQQATDGVALFTIGGFGASLAALAPVAKENGVLVFQPFDAMTYDPLNVIAQPYSVSGASLQAEGMPVTMLELTAKAALSMLRDDQDRLWVEAGTMSGATFVVIARAP